MPIDSHEIQVRVRYCETDAMGYLHHANYFNFFEMGRTELFRAQGGNYRVMEERGYFLVVVKIECHYKVPSRFDDELTIRTRISRQTPAKLEHEYQVFRDGRQVARGHSVLACVDRQGQVQRITDEILFASDGPGMSHDTPRRDSRRGASCDIPPLPLRPYPRPITMPEQSD